MTTQALLILALGCLLLGAALAWLWFDFYRRNRRTKNPSLGNSTMQDVTSKSARFRPEKK
jgi:hypothetical protein